MNIPTSPRIDVPRDVQTPVYFIDESGSKGSAGRFFVVAAVKTTDPDFLTRGMMALRQRESIHKELKFSGTTRRSVPFLKQLIDMLHKSGASIGAFVIDKNVHDPFIGQELWEAHAWSTSALIKGMTTRRELATILQDGISTPANVAYGTHIKKKINSHYRTMRVISAVSLDSKTCDGLQLADLVASSIAYARRKAVDLTDVEFSRLATPKAEVARYLARTFDLPNFGDIKTTRVNIKSVYPPK